MPNYPEVVIEETGPSTENDNITRATAVFQDTDRYYTSSSDANNSNNAVGGGLDNSNKSTGF